MITKSSFPNIIIKKGAGNCEIPCRIKTDNSDEHEAVAVLEIPQSKSGKRWQDNDFLIIDCMADMNSTLTMEALFYTEDELRFNIHNTLIGGRRIKCCFELKYLDSSRAFPRNLPGHLKSMAAGKPVSVDEIDRVEIKVFNAPEFNDFYIYGISVTDTLPDLKVTGEPLVDKLGQNNSASWKWKTESQEELIKFLHAEYEWSKTHNRYLRDDYDKYGGWTGLKFEKRGHFYRHHDGKRWWLVDPEGNAFFSNGICYASRTGIYGIVDALEELFEELPNISDPAFLSAWTTADKIPEFVKRNGTNVAKSKRVYNFARANMIRAFGKDKWWEAWVSINRARVKTWGFNTIGVGVNTYTDEDTVAYLKAAEIPYCITLKDFPKTEKLLYRDFPDVFGEEYRTLCEKFSRQLEPFCNDEYFIGYFINNEPEWMFQSDINIAEQTLTMSETTASKIKLQNILKGKYNSITALNKVWNTHFESFEKITLTGDILSRDAFSDLNFLNDILIDAYSKIPSECLRKVAPNALNLGLRYSTFRNKKYVANNSFDALSFNHYSRNPKEAFESARDTFDMPFMVGEWHIGAAESGLMSGALVNATTQNERGKACAEYLRCAFINSNCVGVHYFELNDQPLLGRFDGENMQVGLIDVCNRPYADCIKHIISMNYDMYEILSQKIVPKKIEWKYHYRY